MNAPTETTRPPDLRAEGGTVLRTLENLAHRVAPLDPALVAATLVVAFAAGYAILVMPAELVVLLVGVAVAVALATVLPVAVVRAVGAVLARTA